jgi:hypothetical protein
MMYFIIVACFMLKDNTADNCIVPMGSMQYECEAGAVGGKEKASDTWLVLAIVRQVMGSVRWCLAVLGGA